MSVEEIKAGWYQQTVNRHWLPTEVTNPETKQDWCERTLGLYAEVPQIPFGRPIKKQKPIAQEAILTGEAIEKRAVEFGFRFQAFSDLLNTLGWWKKVGPLVDKVPADMQDLHQGEINWDESITFSPDQFHYLTLLNIINGSAPIDYEVAFPELKEELRQLKLNKCNLTVEEMTQEEVAGRSSLCVADILGCLCLEKLIEGLPVETKAEIRQLNALILNDRVGYKDRNRAYERLQQLHKTGVPTSDLDERLNQALAQLLLPEDHAGYCQDPTELLSRQLKPEVMIVLHSSDELDNSVKARRLAALLAPGVFVMPSGGIAPHFSKRVDMPEAVAKVYEAEATIAMLVNLKETITYQDRVNQVGKPLDIQDILYPDPNSTDTPDNAANVANRIGELVNQLKHPLTLLIVTSDLHSARAWAEFRNRIPQNLAKAIFVYGNPETPHLNKTVAERKIHGLIFMFNEYIKRAYMTATYK